MFYTVPVFVIGLGITRPLAIRYYHNILPAITITSRYSDSAIIDIARNFIHNTSQYLCHWRNSEFIDSTQSISQELQNIVKQFHMNDSQVNKEYIAQWLFLTHTLTTTIIKYQYVWVSELLKPFLKFYLVVYLCLDKDKVVLQGGVVVVGQKKLYDIWPQCIDNVPQDEISWYITVSLFWNTPCL